MSQSEPAIDRSLDEKQEVSRTEEDEETGMSNTKRISKNENKSLMSNDNAKAKCTISSKLGEQDVHRKNSESQISQNTLIEFQARDLTNGKQANAEQRRRHARDHQPSHQLNEHPSESETRFQQERSQQQNQSKNPMQSMNGENQKTQRPSSDWEQRQQAVKRKHGQRNHPQPNQQWCDDQRANATVQERNISEENSFAASLDTTQPHHDHLQPAEHIHEDRSAGGSITDESNLENQHDSLTRTTRRASQQSQKVEKLSDQSSSHVIQPMSKQEKRQGQQSSTGRKSSKKTVQRSVEKPVHATSNSQKDSRQPVERIFHKRGSLTHTRQEQHSSPQVELSDLEVRIQPGDVLKSGNKTHTSIDASVGPGANSLQMIRLHVNIRAHASWDEEALPCPVVIDTQVTVTPPPTTIESGTGVFPNRLTTTISDI